MELLQSVPSDGARSLHPGDDGVGHEGELPGAGAGLAQDAAEGPANPETKSVSRRSEKTGKNPGL